jgi:outer membrane protein assembly factor BamB
MLMQKLTFQGRPTARRARLSAVSAAIMLTAEHILFVLDALNGTERRRFTAPVGELLTIAALGDRAVFVAGGDAKVYAVDLGSGAIVWTFDGHGSLGSQHEPIDALAGGVLYLAGGDRDLRIGRADRSPALAPGG